MPCFFWFVVLLAAFCLRLVFGLLACYGSVVAISVYKVKDI